MAKREEYAVETVGLSKTYNGEVRAVAGLNLKIKPGTLFGFLGPNGAGKSSVVRMLTGQTTPTSGLAFVHGNDISKDRLFVRKIAGVIPEQENPPAFLTAREYLTFICRIRGLSDIEKRIDFWFDFFDFSDQQNILCKDLSRGTKQKLIAVQAFIHEPKIVFIDEPLLNLDPIAQRKLKDYLKGYVKKGNTVFLSTHVLSTADEICTHLAIINKGKVVASGEVKKLKKSREKVEDLFLRLVKRQA